MLIIDEQQVASKLRASIEAYRAMEEDARYIFFAMCADMDAKALKEAVIEAAKEHSNGDTTLLFALRTGDVCVLSCDLHSRVANPLIEQVSNLLNKPESNEWVVYQKLSSDGYGISKLVREQAEAEQSDQLEDAKRKEAEQQALRRKMILGAGSKTQAAELNQRRIGRDKRKIMIIEDDIFSRKLVTTAIKKPLETIALPDASHALDTYITHAPDMLLLDINLPDVTGHELLERIIALDPDAYVVMLSGNADATNIKTAMSKGASGFIGKPFSKDRLFQYIQKCPTIDMAIA